MFNVVLESPSGSTQIDTAPQFIPIGIAHSSNQFNNAPAIGHSSMPVFLSRSITFVSWDPLSDKQRLGSTGEGGCCEET